MSVLSWIFVGLVIVVFVIGVGWTCWSTWKHRDRPTQKIISEGLDELATQTGLQTQDIGEVCVEGTHDVLGRAVGRLDGYDVQVLVLGCLGTFAIHVEAYLSLFTLVEVRFASTLPERKVTPRSIAGDDVDRLLGELAQTPATVWLHADHLTVVPGEKRPTLVADPQKLHSLLDGMLDTVTNLGAQPLETEQILPPFLPAPTPPSDLAV